MLYLYQTYVAILLAVLQLSCTFLSAAQADPAVEIPLAYGQLRHKPPPKSYVACRCSGGLTVDGHITDACWAAAPWTDSFIDIVGPTGPKPWFNTRAKMLWDDEHLYIAAQMEEPRAFANQTLHDSIIYHDNDFEVFIDPDGDNHMYYELEINALGHIWDLFLVKPYRNGGPAVMNWETIKPAVHAQTDGPTGWRPVTAAVHVDGAVNAATGSTSWTVELALPWSILKQAAHRQTPPLPGDQWRINLSRVQWNVTWDETSHAYIKVPEGQVGYNWVWSPQWQVAMHQPETWGYVQFEDVTVPRPGNADGASCANVAGRFKPDATWPARALLMDVYYAQTVCWQKRHQFCRLLEEMNITDISEELAVNTRIETTSVSFVALTNVTLPNRDATSVITVSVDQTGRLVQYPARSVAGGTDKNDAYDPFSGDSVWMSSDKISAKIEVV